MPLLRAVPVTISYTSFYQLEFPRMVSLACTICGDYQQGEDVAQEAMARAHRHWPRVSEYDRPGAWVRRVTINLSLSRVQRAKRELIALRRIAGERPEPLHAEPGFDIDVWDAVKKLSPRQRAVVGLFYQEDLSTTDIAEALGCSVSTATSHLNQARHRLAQLLDGSTEKTGEAPS